MTELLDTTSKENTLLLDNSAHISILNEDTDKLLDRRMLHDVGKKIITHIFLIFLTDSASQAL